MHALHNTIHMHRRKQTIRLVQPPLHLPSLKVGNNTLGVWLGNGWWNPLPLLMWGRLNLRSYIATGEPTFIARLLVEYADGTSDNLVSDLSWLTHPSPILKNNICTSVLCAPHKVSQSRGLYSLSLVLFVRLYYLCCV